MAWSDIIGVLIPTYQQWQDFLNHVKNLALEDLAVSDTTTNNASTAKHGLMPKGDGVVTHFYRSDGTQAVPAGAAGIGGATGATDGAILLADGVSSDTIKTSSKTIETTLTDSDTKVPTSGAVTDALAGKMPNPWYDYRTLLVQSAMVTAAGVVDQASTSGQANQYVYAGFTDGGSESVQFMIDFPDDWNGTDGTLGKVIIYFIWTATSGSGTVKFVIAGKLFADDDAWDTALATLGNATDTLIVANDKHVSPATTAAVISPVGAFSGKTAILKVTRDSATDTLNATAQLIGVRVKFIRTGAY